MMIKSQVTMGIIKMMMIDLQPGQLAASTQTIIEPVCSQPTGGHAGMMQSKRFIPETIHKLLLNYMCRICVEVKSYGFTFEFFTMKHDVKVQEVATQMCQEQEIYLQHTPHP